MAMQLIDSTAFATLIAWTPHSKFSTWLRLTIQIRPWAMSECLNSCGQCWFEVGTTRGPTHNVAKIVYFLRVSLASSWAM